MLFERAGDPLVPIAAAADQKTFIRGVAQECMLEAEASFHAAAFRKHDSRSNQFLQSALKFVPFGRYRVEQREGELPTDHGGDLRHVTCLAETIQTRHQ